MAQPNRLIPIVELDAACAEQARVWREQWAEAMREAPGVPYTPRPAVPAAVRAACDHCWHTLHTTQMCCWCGQPRTTPHGPYLPEGDR